MQLTQFARTYYIEEKAQVHLSEKLETMASVFVKDAYSIEKWDIFTEKTLTRI